MKTVMFAAGLVATASAAHLRSEQLSQNAAIHAEISALAEKYNCADGKKGLEEVIGEIKVKNSAETVQLNSDCDTARAGYMSDLASENDRATGIRSAAEPDAEQVRAGLEEVEQSTHDSLVTKHAGQVAAKQSTADDAKSAHIAQDALYNGANGQVSTYTVEVALLASQRTASAKKHADQEAKAIADLASGSATQSERKKDEIGRAAQVKVVDDEAAQVLWQGRDDIVTTDRVIVAELKSFKTELDTLEQTARPDAAFLEVSNKIRAGVHANYNTLLDTKNKEITSWKSACTVVYDKYATEQTTEQTAAQKIRDETDGIRGATFTEEKTASDLILSNLRTYHTQIVNDATELAAAKLADFTTKNSDYITKKMNFETVTATVTAERADNKEAAEIERTAIETEKNRVINKAIVFLTGVTEKAQKLMDQEKATCQTAFDKRTNFLAGDEAVMAELAPLLEKLGRCSGTDPLGSHETSLLEVSAKETAACVVNDMKLQSLLEKSAAPKRTTGSFADWKKRIAGEHADAKRIDNECKGAAQGGYDKTTGNAQTVKDREEAAAIQTASSETTAANDKLEQQNAQSADDFKEAKDPHDVAKGLNDAALLVKDDTARKESAARNVKSTEIDAGVNHNVATVATAEAKRVKAIKDDNTEADRIQTTAEASYTDKMAKQTEKCTTEDALLKDEAATLSAVIGKMDALQKANHGLTFSDEKSLGEDITALEGRLAEEVTENQQAKKVNLKASLDLHDKTVEDAKSHFNAEMETLNTAKSDADTAGDTALEQETISYTAREVTNNADYKSATEIFNEKKTADEVAAKALTVAKRVENDEVSSSASDLSANIQRFINEKEATIKTKMAEALSIDEAAAKVELSQRTVKDSECTAANKDFAAELATLTKAQGQIDSLVTVRDDKIGA